MKTITLLLSCLALSACLNQADGLKVYVRTDTSYDLLPDAFGKTAPWSDTDRDWAHAGARMWRDFGFDVRPLDEAIDPSLTELPADVIAYPETLDGYDLSKSYITVTIYRDGSLAEEGKYAGLDPADGNRWVFVNSAVSGDYLMTVVAHEFGHLLLRAGHTPDGEKAIMSPAWTTDSFTQADDDLACASPSQRCEHDFN